MNTGAFGENFPYTNFHDLNLDWIIKTQKETQDQLTEAMETFETDVQEVREIGEQATASAESASDSAEEASGYVTEAQQYAESAEQSARDAQSAEIKRRFIFIGDSYGQGWTPDGTVESWVAKLSRVLNISSDDSFSACQGGAGFWISDTSDTRYIPALLQSAYNSVTTPETITDIVFGLGYNDINGFDQVTTLQTVAVSTMTKIRTLFPQNPRVWLFGIGYTTNHFNQYKLMSVYKIYSSFSGFGFQNLTKCLNEKGFFASDGIHMNGSGQTRIAQIMSQVLNYGTINNETFQNFPQDVQALFKNIVTNNNMNGPVYTFRQDDRLIITCPTNSFLATTFASTDDISLSRTPIKIGTYENTILTGFHNWSRVAQMFPCDIIYQAVGLAGYHCINGYINIAPESDNDNNLYIWLSIFRTTDDFTNYLTISNITRLQIAGFNMEFKQIG